eukprot:764636-Hanusia_phi.AAC.4
MLQLEAAQLEYRLHGLQRPRHHVVVLERPDPPVASLQQFLPIPHHARPEHADVHRRVVHRAVEAHRREPCKSARHQAKPAPPNLPAQPPQLVPPALPQAHPEQDELIPQRVEPPVRLEPLLLRIVVDAERRSPRTRGSSRGKAQPGRRSEKRRRGKTRRKRGEGRG